MRRMIRRPTHPGNIIKEDYLLPLSISIKDMAESLCISRKTLSKIINERGAVTPDMSLRLSRAFDTTPGFLAYATKKLRFMARRESITGVEKGKTVSPKYTS